MRSSLEAEGADGAMAFEIVQSSSARRKPFYVLSSAYKSDLTNWTGCHVTTCAATWFS